MSEQHTISAIAASNGINYLIDDVSKSTVSVDNVHADVNILHISQADYEQLVATDEVLSNTLYIVSADYIETYGQQIKNLAPGTDLSDAVNFEQLSEVSARAIDTYTKTETDQKIANAQYFKKYVVESLPPLTAADDRGIYLVPSTDSELSNVYDEYVTVGEGAQKSWEKIGAKNIDLSGYKTKQTAKTSPTASSTATAFIDTITQNENGEITATKKTVQSASTSQAGIVQLNNSLTSTSTTQAATANAVKSLNDAKVETSVKVAGQALTADVAAATISSAIGLSDYSLTNHTHAEYVPTSRTVAGYQLTADVTAANISSAIDLGNYVLDISALHKTGDETASGKKTFSDAFTVGDRKSGSTVGTKSFTYGANNVASGEGSFAGGQYSVASEYGAHAEGNGVSATGYMSFAVGQYALASGYTAYAEGYGAKASGYYSHAEGYMALAAGDSSHAEGYQASATGSSSHAEGNQTKASGEASHAEGQMTLASAYGSHAEGYETSATQYLSHAEGQMTLASAYGSHAEGYETSATQYLSHAEGQMTLASGYCSHVEGYGAKATGDRSHAEGLNTVAAGSYGSHAEGTDVSAIGNCSHAEGDGTIAQNTYEHAQGSYNFSNSGNDYALQTIDSVGIGNYTARKNATEVMRNGDAYFLGVGGYDGTNAASATSKPLAAVLSGKEDMSNKVTALLSTSTDDQYPTAKCMYDIIGNIESALDIINNGGAQ